MDSSLVLTTHMRFFLGSAACALFSLGQVSVQLDTIRCESQLAVLVGRCVRRLILHDRLLECLSLPLNGALHFLTEFLVHTEVLDLQLAITIFLSVDQIAWQLCLDSTRELIGVV